MFDPDTFLMNLKATHPRLLFFPHHGWPHNYFGDISSILSLDYDVFVFSAESEHFDGPHSKNSRAYYWKQFLKEAKNEGFNVDLFKSTVRTRVFQKGKKWGILFFQDSNTALQRIIDASYTIKCLIGFRDNHIGDIQYHYCLPFCVNEPPFLAKILEASETLLDYFTDHSSILMDKDKSKKNNHRWFKRLHEMTLNNSIYRFSLVDLLVRDGHMGNPLSPRFPVPLYEIIENPSNYSTLLAGRFKKKYFASKDTNPLWRLLSFRIKYEVGIIAYYRVSKKNAQIAIG